MTVYVLKDGSGHIVGFGDTPFGLAAGLTQEEIAGTLGDYAGRFRLSVDKPVIAADGADEATVTVSTTVDPAPASIDVDVDGVTESVSISGGSGTLVITADVPGVITIGPADPAAYSPAGEGSLTITAQEA